MTAISSKFSGPRQVAIAATGQVVECSAMLDASQLSAEYIAAGRDDDGRAITLPTDEDTIEAARAHAALRGRVFDGDLIRVEGGIATFVLMNEQQVTAPVAALSMIAASSTFKPAPCPPSTPVPKAPKLRTIRGGKGRK